VYRISEIRCRGFSRSPFKVPVSLLCHFLSLGRHFWCWAAAFSGVHVFFFTFGVWKMAKWWNFISKVATSDLFFPSLFSWYVHWYPLYFRCLGSADSNPGWRTWWLSDPRLQCRHVRYRGRPSGAVKCWNFDTKVVKNAFLIFFVSCWKYIGLGDLGATRSNPGWRTWRLGDVWRQCCHVRHRGRPWGTVKSPNFATKVAENAF